MIVNRDKYLQELVSSRHNGLVAVPQSGHKK